MIRLLLALALLSPAACHKNEPAAPTPAQAAQLNEAEDMLNAMADNEEGPETNVSSPSNSSD
jgi:hypothetical protein